MARRSSCVARALRGGLWRRRRFCQSASRARCGAVCGSGGGLWREEVAALRGGLWRRRFCQSASRRALRGGLWRRRFCQSGRRVARREAVALRGGLWRRRRSVARNSSCVAGRSVAAAAFLPISKPRALRGGLWRRGRSVAAVCGSGGGLWREEVAALRGGLDGPLAKGGPNGRHRPPLPCALPMEGFPYEFGPETER